jgi:hypothetical protein
MAALGIAMIVVVTLLDLEEMWLLAGMLLVVAGLVKIVMVYVWVNVAGLGSSQRPLDDS